VKVSSSEYLLLAAAVEVAVRTVALPNLLLLRWCTCLLVLFRLLLIALALIEDDKFISVNGYTWKLSCSITIFHHVLVMLLRYNSGWGTFPFNKLISIGSYSITLQLLISLEKMVDPFLAPCLRIWLFFGLDLPSWQNVGLAALLQVTIVGV